MRPLVGLLERVSRSDEHVVVCGESASDKAWVARFIHSESSRKARPFVTYVAAAPNRSVTPASAGTDGSIARAWFAATGGTLFIPELADLSDWDQAQLLRFLESRNFRSSLSERSHSPVRVIAAMRVLLVGSQPASLRSSLFHRLNVMSIQLPPDHASLTDEYDVPSHLSFREQKMRLLEAWEPEYLRELLAQVGGNLALAARRAGIARAHLYRLLKKYRLAR
jgi:DNA-binding NtrC family response regulator